MNLAVLLWIAYFYNPVDSFNYQPSNREINVFENDGYYLGFDYHKYITRCDYKSNKGQSSSFKVEPVTTIPSTRQHRGDGTRNAILEGGSRSTCSIDVSNVTLDGATSWTLTAKDDRNVMQEVTFQINIFSYNTLRHTPHSQTVYVAEGGEYRVGFWYNKAVQSCMYETSDGREKTQAITYSTHNTVREHWEVKPTRRDNVLHEYFTVGTCKLHMTRATADGPSWITMTAIGYNQNISTITFDINVITKDSLEFVPSSRKITWIPEGGEYDLGFSYHLGISKCFVQSDSGIDFSFVVDSTGITKEMENEEYGINQVNNFVPYKSKGRICKIVVRNADYETRTWTITASDGINNITSETVEILKFARSHLLNNAIYINKGASFAQTILGVDNNVIKCTLHSVNNTIDFYVKDGNHNANANPISKHIVPWNYGTCGFKFLNIEKANVLSNRKWNLIATGSDGLRYGNTFSVQLVSYPEERLREVVLGDSYYVGCHYGYQEFCELYSPSGTLVRRGYTCDYNINTVSLADIGEWKCVASMYGAMESLTFSIILKRIDQGLHSSAKDDDEYLTLTCGFTKQTQIDTCQMYSPTNTRYVLNPYLALNRHTALGTNFKEGKCAMQIKKPLKLEENGIWKCEINADDHIFGAVIVVGDGSVERPSDETYSKKTFKAFEPFLLVWDVSFSSPNCYIQSPNGEVFSSDHPYQSTFGRCTLLVPQTYTARNGNWTCYFAQPDSTEIVESVIDVQIREFSPPHYYVRAHIGSSLILSYLSGGEPIQRCIFVSPNNESYYVRNHQKSERMIYKGKGFEYGECGIEIPKTNENHFGMWKCFAKIHLGRTAQNASANIWVIDSKADVPVFDELGSVASISAQKFPPSGNSKDNMDSSESSTWIVGITLGLIALVGIGLASLFVHRRYKPQPILVKNRNNEAVNMAFFNTDQNVQAAS